MALDEEQPRATQEMRSAADCLRACPALASVDAPTLEALGQRAVHFSLPAGWNLFEAGSDPDGMYVLASGRLGVNAGGGSERTAVLGRGEIVGESGWLLQEPRSAHVVALRDSELVWLPSNVLGEIAAHCANFSLAIARSCAGRLRGSNRRERSRAQPRVFTVVPNSPETGAGDFACLLVEELSRSGRAELVWDVRASAHTSEWFNRIEESNDFIVYLADCAPSGWTRQCCRQADLVLLAADARGDPKPWAAGLLDDAHRRGIRIELALLHQGAFAARAAAQWLPEARAASHHHIVEPLDVGRLARLITHRGVGLVLSGGGARGFAHLGVIRALREARVPIDFVGGVSIGGVIAGGVALGWSDEEMRLRYQRSFVDGNPLGDYTFPFVALTRGRKVSAMLRREFGEICIEDLRLPFFCLSANLTTGRTLEHREGPLWRAMRASVAIPGIMPPVFYDEQILVDGAAINNLPVDTMQGHAPGLVIGCDVGADRSLATDYDAADQPPFWRLFSRSPSGKRRINIFQILMRASIINSASCAAAQRGLADVLLKPPLQNVDLLNWQSFDRAIAAGYDYARSTLDGLPRLPRLTAQQEPARRRDSLTAEIDKRLRNRAAAR